MQQGPDGLQPSDGFLDNAMAPRPSFNDASPKGKCAHKCCRDKALNDEKSSRFDMRSLESSYFTIRGLKAN